MEAEKISNGSSKQNTLVLTSQLRQDLKKPLGILIEGTPDETMKQLEELIKKEKPTKIISVGDFVTKNITQRNIPLYVVIVDNKVMRKPSKGVQVTPRQTVNVKNPSGTITSEAWGTIEEAMKRKTPTRVLVDGEEDLLTLVAALTAPSNSFVIYGQPLQGIVIIKINKNTRERMRQILEAMESVSKS